MDNIYQNPNQEPLQQNQSNTPEPEPKKTNSVLKIVVVAIILLIAGGGYLYYESQRGSGGLGEDEKELTQELTADWEMYQNEKYEFRLKYPKSWEAKEGIIVGYTDNQTDFGTGFVSPDEPREFQYAHESLPNQYAALKVVEGHDYFKLLLQANTGLFLVFDSEEKRWVLEYQYTDLPRNDEFLKKISRVTNSGIPYFSVTVGDGPGAHPINIVPIRQKNIVLEFSPFMWEGRNDEFINKFNEITKSIELFNEITKSIELVNEVGNACNFSTDVLGQLYGEGVIHGYYQPVERIVPWDFNGATTTCNGFVVTDGCSELVNELVDLVDRGNTVHSKNEIGQAVINLDFYSMDSLSKEKIRKSDLENQVGLNVLKPKPRGTEAPSCFNFVEVLEVLNSASTSAQQEKAIRIISPTNGTKIDYYADFTVRWEVSPLLANQTVGVYVSGVDGLFTCLPGLEKEYTESYDCDEALVAEVPASLGAYVFKINPGCKNEMPVYVRIATKYETVSDSVGPIILQGGACDPG